MDPVAPNCQSLIEKIGFPLDHNCKPYLAYIVSQEPDLAKLAPWLQLFIAVVDYFKSDDAERKKDIDSLIAAQDAHFYFDDVLELPKAENHKDLRRKNVSDTIFRILGIWALMGSYFDPETAPFRYIEAISRTNEGKTLHSLVKASGLLPSAMEASCANPPDSQSADTSSTEKHNTTTLAPGNANTALSDKSADSISINKTTTTALNTPLSVHLLLANVEALSISSKQLNAYRLFTYAHTGIHWTTNISRHMLLTRQAGRYYLELFLLPCVLEGRSEEAVKKSGLSSLLLLEIRDSYAALFNPKQPSLTHKLLLRWLGARWWCWCLSCSSRRFLRREIEARKETHRQDGMFDPKLESYASWKAPDWTQTQFPSLWPRIVTLEAHVQKARPWGFWVLFRDRRDTLQYWTFLFGTLILFLTCVQVALGVTQVIGSF